MIENLWKRKSISNVCSEHYHCKIVESNSYPWEEYEKRYCLFALKVFEATEKDYHNKVDKSTAKANALQRCNKEKDSTAQKDCKNLIDYYFDSLYGKSIYFVKDVLNFGHVCQFSS